MMSFGTAKYGCLNYRNMTIRQLISKMAIKVTVKVISFFAMKS